MGDLNPLVLNIESGDTNVLGGHPGLETANFDSPDSGINFRGR